MLIKKIIKNINIFFFVKDFQCMIVISLKLKGLLFQWFKV